MRALWLPVWTSFFLCFVLPVAADERKLEPFLASGPTASVTAVNLTHDGKRMLTTALDSTAILWDTATGEQLHTFSGQGSRTFLAALSADGKRVATLKGAPVEVTLWDGRSGKQLRTFAIQGASSPKYLALSEDGERLLLHEPSRLTVLLETATGKEHSSYQDRKNYVSSAALSADGKYVVLTPGQRTTSLWDTATGQKVATFEGHHTRGITSVAISADGQLVLTGSEDSTVCLWSARAKAPLQQLRGHGAPVRSVALSADGVQIFTSDDGTAILWDRDKGQPRHRCRGHTLPISSVAVSGDGKVLATGSADKSVRLWDPASGVQRYLWQREPLLGLALTADGGKLAALEGHAALLWDTATGHILHKYTGGALTCMTLTPDGARLSVGAQEGRVTIWETATVKARNIFALDSDPVRGVGLAADHSWCAWALRQRVHAHGLQGNKARHTYDAPRPGKPIPPKFGALEAYTCLAMSADGKFIVAGTEHNNVVLIEPPGGMRPLHRSESANSAIRAIAVSADGQQILAGSTDRAAILIHRVGGAALHLRGHTEAVCSVAFAADGKRVVTGSVDRTAILWDAATGNKLQTFEGHTALVNGVALSPDGKQLWTCAHDSTIRLWDTTSGKELCRLVSFEGGKEWLVVTPNGFCDGSAGGLQRLVWRDPATGQRFDDEATRRRFQRPGLLATLLKGERPRLDESCSARVLRTMQLRQCV